MCMAPSHPKQARPHIQGMDMCWGLGAGMVVGHVGMVVGPVHVVGHVGMAGGMVEVRVVPVVPMVPVLVSSRVHAHVCVHAGVHGQWLVVGAIGLGE